jgi:chitinase
MSCLLIPEIFEGNTLTANTFRILSFLLTSGPADQVEAWTQLSADQRSAIKSEYNNAGINLMVSAFGSTDEPTTAGRFFLLSISAFSDVAYVKVSIQLPWRTPCPTLSKNSISMELTWIMRTSPRSMLKTERLNNGSSLSRHNCGPTFLLDSTSLLMPVSLLSSLCMMFPLREISLAVAPWFSHEIYPTGAYHRVNQEVGNMIDWYVTVLVTLPQPSSTHFDRPYRYNIQFYNQGASEYTTCDGLLNESSSTFPNTAVFQINQDQGVDMSKIVIGVCARHLRLACNGLTRARCN